jgi:hypothetical protein
VILTGYLDESGTHDGSPVTVMGGMLANARQWEAFEQNFRKAKAKHGFRIFHTKKFKKRDGDFKGWTNDQCLALMADLAPMTATAFTEGVTVALYNDAYEAEYRLGDKPRRLRDGSILDDQSRERRRAIVDHATAAERNRPPHEFFVLRHSSLLPFR